MTLLYLDSDLNTTDRKHATYDPFGRRMDHCLTPECPNTPKYYLCTIDGKEYHTRLCDECLWTVELRIKYNLRRDPELS